MSGMKPYIVRQGDYLAKIAFTEGFDGEQVWNHEKNAPLRESGREPNVLCPSDVLCIPEESALPQPLSLECANSLSALVPVTKVLVRFVMRESSLASATFVATGAGFETRGAADAEGVVHIDVPTVVSRVEIYFEEHGVRFGLMIGHLDPMCEATGIKQRLANLGCISDLNDELDDALQPLGIAELQRSCGLDASGTLSDETRIGLKRSHGV